MSPEQFLSIREQLPSQEIGALALRFIAEPGMLPEKDEDLSVLRRLGLRLLGRNEAISESRDRASKNEATLTRYGVFEKYVDALSLQELAIIPEGRKRPRSLDQFSFLPIVHRDKWPSIYSAHASARIPKEIRTTCEGKEGWPPWLDTHYAIGLTRCNWLVAVGAAGVDHDGTLMIKQLQDVSGTTRKKGAKAHFSTGLHDGFLWKETLVAAWSAVAIDLGIGSSLTIQSSANNSWRQGGKKEFPQYDELAQRLHFTRSSDEHDWKKQLPRKPA